MFMRVCSRVGCKLLQGSFCAVPPVHPACHSKAGSKAGCMQLKYICSYSRAGYMQLKCIWPCSGQHAYSSCACVPTLEQAICSWSASGYTLGQDARSSASAPTPGQATRSSSASASTQGPTDAAPMCWLLKGRLYAARVPVYSHHIRNTFQGWCMHYCYS